MTTEKRPRPCGNPECSTSSGIHEWDDGVSESWPGRFWGLTFGSGELDSHGCWEHPCDICAREHEIAHPERGPCWPFEDEAAMRCATGGDDPKNWRPPTP